MLVLTLMFAAFFVIGPLAFAVWILSSEVTLVTVIVALVCVGLSIFFAVRLHDNYQWVELDGEYIRGRTLFTRLLVEQRVDDLIKVTSLYFVSSPSNALLIAIYGDVFGYALKFKTGPVINIGKQDMTEADALMVAIRRAAPQGVQYSERKPR